MTLAFPFASFTFDALTVAGLDSTFELFRLATISAATALLLFSLFTGLLAGLFVLVGLLAGFAGLITGFLAMASFLLGFDGLVATLFVLAAGRTDGLETEDGLGFGVERSFAFAPTASLLAVFAVAFAITLGRLESVSLIRIPFYKIGLKPRALRIHVAK